MFWERFETLCKEKGLTANGFAASNGISSGSISNWKKKTPSPKYLKKIAEAFDVSIDYLTGKTNERKPQKQSEKNILVEKLNKKEILIIKKYRLASKSVQDGIDSILEINSDLNIVDDMVETIKQNSDVPTKAN